MESHRSGATRRIISLVASLLVGLRMTLIALLLIASLFTSVVRSSFSPGSSLASHRRRVAAPPAETTLHRDPLFHAYVYGRCRRCRGQRRLEKLDRLHYQVPPIDGQARIVALHRVRFRIRFASDHYGVTGGGDHLENTIKLVVPRGWVPTKEAEREVDFCGAVEFEVGR